MLKKNKRTKFYNYLTSAVAVLTLVCHSAGLSASAARFRADIDSATSHLTSGAGIKITSLSRGDTIYEKNAASPLNLASVTKLIVTAASLKFLGGDYRFHTKYFLSNNGDLHVVGEGDPLYVIEDMEETAANLKRIIPGGVRNIVVDDSFFGDYTSPGLPGNKDSATPFTGALSLNFNRGMVDVSAGKQSGGPAKVGLYAGTIGIDFNNEVKTVGRKAPSFLVLDPPENGGGKFTLRGQAPAGKKGRRHEVSVSLPPLFFAEALKALLMQNRVKVSGNIFKGVAPRDSKLIYDHASEPLYEIIDGMNKHSNNFIAEQLLKVLGAKYLKEPGTTAGGIKLINKYLETLNVPAQNYRLINGSGLTYDNFMSADQIVKVISDSYHNKNWKYFENSLCVAGVNGTLKRRFKKSPVYGNLKAKTGTVNSAKSIAGVVTAGDGELLAFAIILNGPENIRNYKKLHDNIAYLMASFTR